MIQAIETHYRGYRFRSRLEARWAVFFDALSLRWLYEPEGFVIHKGTVLEFPYLPDFYLPDWDLFIEVKPDLPVDDFPGENWGLLTDGVDAAGQARHTTIARFMLAAGELTRKPAGSAGPSKPGLVMACGTPGVPRLSGGVDKHWCLTDGSVVVNLTVINGERGKDWIFVMNTFAMVDGGTGLDLWPIYLEAPEIVPGTKEPLWFSSPILPRGTMPRGYIGKGIVFNSNRLTDAYSRSREARFEHGESP